MSRYYVKPIVEMNAFDCSVRYGVYEYSENTGIHCKETDPNLILWTYREEIARNICLLLEIDDFTWQHMNFK